MKKILSLIILIITFLLLIPYFKEKVSAENAYITGCLEIVEANLDIEVGGKKDHVAKVKGEGFPSGKEIYIVGCISSEAGIKCTSGEEQINNKLNQIGFLTDPFPGHEFKALQNPVISQDGKVEVILRSATPAGQNHTFFGVAEVKIGEYGGQAATISYGTFGFSEDPKKCIGINWDPKGRVFDSKSLEPLPNTFVRLFNKDKQMVILPGVKNPINTKEDGLFNFFVPNGIYYLDVQKDNYQIYSNLTELNNEINSKYKNIYYCDSIVGVPLYIKDTKLVEENRLIHCDVPLKPLGNPYQSTGVKLMDYGQIRLGSYTKIYGTFSHPLTKIKIKQNQKLIVEITADKFGAWSYFLDNNKIASNEPITVEGIKNQTIYSSQQSKNFLKKLISLFLKPVFSQFTSTYNFHPILSYIEGYAYDNEGKIIPNAKVSVIPEMTKKVFYTTTADSKGFFKIESNRLPIVPYYLQFTNPNSSKTTVLTTSVFVKKNINYLNTEKINLLTKQVYSTTSSQLTKEKETDKKQTTTSPLDKDGFNYPTGEKNPKQNDVSNNSVSNETKDISNKSKDNSLFLIIVITIFILIITVFILIYFFYIKKKNTEVY